MVLEIAEIQIRPGEQAAFNQAIAQGLELVLSKSPGFMRATVHRGIESPERYVLQIEWESLQSHTVDFRQSPAFAQWRAIVGPFFAQAPRVEHFELVTTQEVSAG